MKRHIFSLPALAYTILLFSCSKMERQDYNDNSLPAPPSVSNISVQSKPGGAVIKYKLPSDPNFSYVKADYEIRPGVFRETKASIYLDTLDLVGFGDTDLYNVSIFTVGKNGKESAPTVIQVQPLPAPVTTVFNTINLVATFGGVNVRFENKSRANLAIVVMVDSTGNNDWAPANTFYTAATDGNFSTRGFEPVAKKFAVFVRDRWDNKSDTLIKSLTPFYEEILDKGKMAPYVLKTDAASISQYPLSKIIDGIVNNGENIYASVNDAGLPQSFTLNLGQQVSISRFKLFQRAGSNRVYAANVPKIFEVYGSNAPSADGNWASWQLLGTFHSFRPSGLPFGKTPTAEDVQYASIDGEDFEFTDPVPPIRFIRFKVLETYGMAGQVCISELTFWGQLLQ
ncbi:protein of unknown function [bacterium A37T11]|nr:protein of unknown function [bacterium A37T11]